MDRIMPIDLERAEIKKTFRGYDPTTVDGLLQAASRTIEQLLADNNRLREQVERQRFELERARADENTLKETLLLAQKTADDTRAIAQRHADVIIEEARQSALSERVAGQQRLSEIRWEIERARQERSRALEEWRDFLNRQLREIETPMFAVIESESIQAPA